MFESSEPARKASYLEYLQQHAQQSDVDDAKFIDSDERETLGEGDDDLLSFDDFVAAPLPIIGAKQKLSKHADRENLPLLLPGPHGSKFRVRECVSKDCASFLLVDPVANYQTQNATWQYLFFLRKHFMPNAPVLRPWVDEDFATLKAGDRNDELRTAFEIGCFPAFTETQAIGRAKRPTKNQGRGGNPALGITSCSDLLCSTRCH